MKKLLIAVMTVATLLSGIIGSPAPLWALDDFDKESCEMNCGWRFGSVDFGTAGFRVYESCMRQCNDLYWKAYDKKIKDLEKSAK